MFLTCLPLHCAHEGREVRCRRGMVMCEDGCMPKAGPTVGHCNNLRGSEAVTNNLGNNFIQYLIYLGSATFP